MKSLLSAAAVAMCMVGVASADIDFEGTPGGAIPAGYAGMNWSSEFYSLDGTNYGTDSGYKVLGTWIGFNAFAANVISFSSQNGSEFPISTVDAAAAWRDWVEVRFDGKKNGSVTQSMSVRITADTRNTISLNFNDIDELVMTYVSDSGTNYWTGGDGTHVAYDNFIMDSPCIDFEGTPGGAVPAGYEGMNWSSEFYSLDGTNYGTDSGYKVLGTWVGFNAFAANVISFATQSGDEFNLSTVDAAAAWRDWVDIRFDGKRNGSVIHTSTRRITADSRNVITLNFGNIDELVMTYVADSGTNYWTGGDGTHVAYDNFCIEDAATNMTLRVTGTCPGTVRVQWTDAAPNATVALIFAKNTGNFVIPFGPCQGTVLGLGNQGIRLVNTFPSGPAGSGARSGPAGSAACRGYLQMHDIPNCTTSNVAQLP